MPAWDSPESKAFVENSRAPMTKRPNNHAYVHWILSACWRRRFNEAGGNDREKVREALSKIKYKSRRGGGHLCDHNQARLPMILLPIENGKPSIKGAYTADIQYPAQ